MTFDELNDFIVERDRIYRAWKEGDATDNERILARMAKLAEEMGELSEEVLGSLGYQRQAKLDARTPESLGDEVADVIITTMLLAKAMGVDIAGSLERKMKKIRERSIANGEIRQEHSI